MLCVCEKLNWEVKEANNGYICILTMVIWVFVLICLVKMIIMLCVMMYTIQYFQFKSHV